MIKSRLLATTAALSLLPLGALAQDAYELDDIIVSGGFTPIEAKKYGRSASVLTGDEIEERGISTVQDALRTLPGVSVTGSGDSFTEVRIRGGETNHTLILIDGVEAGAGDAPYILSGLETANIERIEVLRGPQSVFYGSNASSGVINIITKKGGIGTEYGGKIEVGDGYSVSARASSRTERGGIAFSFWRQDDEGYDQSGSDGEEDGIRRNTLSLSGDYLVTDQLKLGFSFRRSDEDYDLDTTNFLATTADEYVVDDPLPYSERDEQQARVFAEYETLGGRLIHNLSLERTDFDQSFSDGTPTETETSAIKYRLSYGLDGRAVTDSDHVLTGFLEWEEDSSSLNPLYERETNSVALEYRGSFANGLDLQAGVRYDDNKVFDDATTWNIGASYTFAGSGVRLHGSAGKGVVNPSYFELFADSFGFIGNPNLRPEENEGFDVGVEVPFWDGRGLVDITYFDETLTDEITSVFNGTGSSFENQIGESDRKGIELSGQLQATDALSLRLSYTYLDATDPDGSIEVRRPEHEVALGATLETFGGRGVITADVRHVAGNYDNEFFGSFQTVELDDYTTVDLGVQYDLTDNLTLLGRVTNLFDEEYSDALGYAKRGRTLYVGLSSQF